MPPRPVLLAVRIAAWRARWWLRAGAVVLVVLAVAHAAAPAPPASVAVVVTAHAVPAGRTLDDGDLRVVHVPPGTVPDGAERTPGRLVGATTAVDVPAGLPVVAELLEGRRFAKDPPDGAVVVAVALGGADVLRTGDRIDLVAPPDGAAGLREPDDAEDVLAAPDVLARGALVLEVRTTQAEGLLGGVDAAPQVLLAVTPDEGHRIAATTEGAALGAVLVG